LLALPLPAIGLAASLITPATTAALMSAVDQCGSGIAAGVLNASRQTGAALGVTLSGALISMNHSIAHGMHLSVQAAGWWSIVAAVVWWQTSKRNAWALDQMQTENS
jgi:DHA2 family methylenomycin A resistance protein-like MFS transporter